MSRRSDIFHSLPDVDQKCLVGSNAVFGLQINDPPFYSSLKLVSQHDKNAKPFTVSLSTQNAEMISIAMEKGAEALMNCLGKIEATQCFVDKVKEINASHALDKEVQEESKAVVHI